MKIGCRTVCFRKLSLEEAMERIRRAGYEYVEPQATAPFCSLGHYAELTNPAGSGIE